MPPSRQGECHGESHVPSRQRQSHGESHVPYDSENPTLPYDSENPWINGQVYQCSIVLAADCSYTRNLTVFFASNKLPTIPDCTNCRGSHFLSGADCRLWSVLGGKNIHLRRKTQLEAQGVCKVRVFSKFPVNLQSIPSQFPVNFRSIPS
jgi:hypothetical protein